MFNSLTKIVIHAFILSLLLMKTCTINMDKNFFLLNWLSTVAGTIFDLIVLRKTTLLKSYRYLVWVASLLLLLPNKKLSILIMISDFACQFYCLVNDCLTWSCLPPLVLVKDKLELEVILLSLWFCHWDYHSWLLIVAIDQVSFNFSNPRQDAVCHN